MPQTVYFEIAQLAQFSIKFFSIDENLYEWVHASTQYDIVKQKHLCKIATKLIAYCHIFFGYKLIAYGSRFYCMTSDRSYSQFIASFILFFLCLAPPVLMIIFCCITLLFLQQ